MSYDLYLKPRSGELDEAQFLEYFRARPHYDGGGQYANDDTGVYFGFEWNSGDGTEEEVDEEDDEEGDEDPALTHPMAFNINFFRPSYFILEAEPEVAALVRHFDLVVLDPQIDGMGEGEYRPEQLLSGWNRGNEFAFSAFLQEPGRAGDIETLPSARLIEVWRWNRDRQALQDATGASKFVPRIIFIRAGDRLLTGAVWPDGLASVLPPVDWLIIPRKDLAPRSFLRKKKDIATAAWADVQNLLLRHGSCDEAGRLTLAYDGPPSEVVRFVQGLPANEGGFTGLPADQVLDRELVEKYASR